MLNIVLIQLLMGNNLLLFVCHMSLWTESPGFWIVGKGNKKKK